MPRLWLLSYALVFLIGGVTGAIAGRWIQWAADRGIPTYQGRTGVMNKFQKELALTPYQVRQTEVILDEAARDFGALHDSAHRLRGETRQRKFDEALSRLERRYGS